jgi:hypothetical protein
MYALVEDDIVVKVASRPTDLRRLDDGASVLWSEYITDDELAACGWFPVVDDPEPSFDPATHVAVRNAPTLVEGVPTRTWTVRELTAEELTARQRDANRAVLSDKATLDAKMVELKTFLSDPDVQVVLDQPNNTALTAQQLNRALKVIVRQLRRNANATMRDWRFQFGGVHPELLDDITDV